MLFGPWPKITWASLEQLLEAFKKKNGLGTSILVPRLSAVPTRWLCIQSDVPTPGWLQVHTHTQICIHVWHRTGAGCSVTWLQRWSWLLRGDLAGWFLSYFITLPNSLSLLGGDGAREAAIKEERGEGTRTGIELNTFRDCPLSSPERWMVQTKKKTVKINGDVQ